MALSINLDITVPQNKEEAKTILINEGKELVAAGKAIVSLSKETSIRTINFVHTFSKMFYENKVKPTLEHSKSNVAMTLCSVAHKIDNSIACAQFVDLKK